MQIATWSIAAIATLGILVRPARLPEFVWALAGAVLLVAAGLLPLPEALAAVAKGTDVYLFLIGMMLLAEIARKEGLFDYLAFLAVGHARGSAKRLFLIVYGVGILVTVFLSNDATAVVLTPAVYAATKSAKVQPLPYLLVCAFIANAASFVLPISNPANLVIFGARMQPLPVWLLHLGLPSHVAIVATFIALRLTQRRSLDEPVAEMAQPVHLTTGGRLAAAGIAVTGIVLLAASTFGMALGLPTFIAGALVGIAVLIAEHRSPLPGRKDVSWGVLPLVAGLFVLVQGVEATGALQQLGAMLRDGTIATAGVAGLAVAIGSNLINKLPMGLAAATASQSANLPPQVTEALAIGVDLGPNLSFTGSLASMLWLIALRREGIRGGSRQFLKLGIVVMPPALVLALAALLLMPR